MKLVDIVICVVSFSNATALLQLSVAFQPVRRMSRVSCRVAFSTTAEVAMKTKLVNGMVVSKKF